MNTRSHPLAILFAALAVFVGASLPSARAGDLETTVLTGKVTLDRGVWAMKLASPVQVYSGGDSVRTQTVQLSGFSRESSELLNNLNGKEIQISGTLKLATSARHVFPVVFTVSDPSIKRLAVAAGRK